MPSLEQHQSAEFVKLFLVGDSGVGKTSALVSLAEHYDLRIIDFDNGLDALVNHLLERFPSRLGSVQYQSILDSYSVTRMGPSIKGGPKAFMGAMKMLEKWPEDDTDPAEWGSDKVLVLDSLTAIGKAAFELSKAINPTYKDPRLWMFPAQQIVENLVALVCGPDFRTNVIIISHVLWDEEDPTKKGLINAIGKALSPRLPRFVNSVAYMKKDKAGNRKIFTKDIREIDLKTPAPMRIDTEYEIESGLAEIFTALKKRG